LDILDPAGSHDSPISAYQSQGAYALPLGHGRGEGHVYRIRIEPGGVIGPHEAGFGQLFLVVTGNGWISGSDGVRHPLATGQGACISRGEVHSKGSDGGLIAIMIQLTELAPGSVARPG
jgi:quercetin dioxygenase-like cupin family protein